MLRTAKSASTAAAIQAATASQPPTPPRPLLTISPCSRAHALVLDANDAELGLEHLAGPTSRGSATKLPPSPGSSRAIRPVVSSSRAQPAGPATSVIVQAPSVRSTFTAPLLGGVQHGRDERLLLRPLGEHVRRLGGTDPGRRRVLQRVRRLDLARTPGRAVTDEAGQERQRRDEGQQVDAGPEDRVEPRGPRPGVARRRGRHVEAGPQGDRRPRRQRAGGDGDRGAVDLRGAPGGLTHADGAVGLSGRHGQVHDQPRRRDRLLPAARDEVPVELRRLRAVAGLEHAVDAVGDHVGVLAGVEGDRLLTRSARPGSGPDPRGAW